MKTLDGIGTLNLAKKIVKLVYTDEYQRQYKPDARSFVTLRGEENWIKSNWLKQLLGINHPLVTAYMRQINTFQFEGQDEYEGAMQFHFHVPNENGTEDVQQYTFAWLLDAYGDLRGAIWELYQIASNLWEPSNGEWDGICSWDSKHLQWVPSDKLAAALDKDHAQLMNFMVYNMLDRHYDEEGWEQWNFFLYDNQVYIGMADYYVGAIVPLEEFLLSPLNHQTIGTSSYKWNQHTQGITLRGVVNGAKLANWKVK